MRIRAILGIVIFFVVSSLYAQQEVEHGVLDTLNIRMELKYSKDKQQNEINNILRAIAYTNQKPVETISINWSLVAHYQVYRYENGSFKTEVSIKALPVVGETKLYEFSAEDYILPKLMGFRLRIFKEDKSLVYLKYFSEKTPSVKSVDEIAMLSMWHQRWAKGYYIVIDEHNFQYNKNDYTFEEWFQMTNDYKAAEFFLKTLSAEYQNLQQNPPSPLLFLLRSLRELNYLTKLSQMPFYQKLVKTKNDPNQLETKMNLLAALMQLNIEKYKILARIEVIESRTNIENLVDVYLDEEHKLLQKKLAFVGIYNDLFNRLVNTKYPENISINDFNLFDVFDAHSIGEKTPSQIAFEDRLYAKSLQQIDELILQENFGEALFKLSNLENFGRQTPADDSDELLFNQLKAKAAYGLYLNYLAVVDKALKIKNTNLAVQYIQKANDFQKIYFREILTNAMVEKKLNELLAICYSDYQRLLDKNLILEAAAKRDTIRSLLFEFRLDGHDAMLNQLNVSDNQALKIKSN